MTKYHGSGLDRAGIDQLQSVHPSRRSLLKLGAATGVASFGVASAADLPAAEIDYSETAHQAQPFFGVHQSGIVTPQPGAAAVVALDVLAKNRGDLERLFRTLTERIAFLMAGGPIPDRDPLFPACRFGLARPGRGAGQPHRNRGARCKLLR